MEILQQLKPEILTKAILSAADSDVIDAVEKNLTELLNVILLFKKSTSDRLPVPSTTTTTTAPAQDFAQELAQMAAREPAQEPAREPLSILGQRTPIRRVISGGAVLSLDDSDTDNFTIATDNLDTEGIYHKMKYNKYKYKYLDLKQKKQQ